MSCIYNVRGNPLQKNRLQFSKKHCPIYRGQKNSYTSSCEIVPRGRMVGPHSDQLACPDYARKLRKSCSKRCQEVAHKKLLPKSEKLLSKLSVSKRIYLLDVCFIASIDVSHLELSVILKFLRARGLYRGRKQN